MSNSCGNTDVTKYFVVQPSGDLGAITATTINATEITLSGDLINCGTGGTIFTKVISGCDDELIINGNVFDNNGNINVINKLTVPVVHSTVFSGGTFYGDGSNLSGITDSYSSGGTYSAGVITITGLGDFTTYNIDVSDLVFTGTPTTTDSYVSGGTLNQTTNELTLTLTEGQPNVVVDLGPLSFSGGSGNCITDLYVTNIYGCSPITLWGDTIINAKLTVNDGSQQDGYVFTSDSGGTGTWDINPYVSGGTVIGSNLILDRTDQLSAVTVDLSSFVNSNDVFVTGGTYNGETLTLNRNDGGNVGISGIIDSYTTGLTFNNSTFDLTISRNKGLPNLVSNLSALADDVFVMGGVYNPSTGIVTYTYNSGSTFQVSGFTTGMTDSYTTDAYLSGNEVRFDNNIQGSNLFNVDLTPILSGFTSTDRFVSGGTYSAGTINYVGNDPITTFSIDVSDLLDDTNTFVTGSTFNRLTDTLTISRNDGFNIETTGITDTYTTTGTVIGSDIILTDNNSQNITIDASSFFDDTNTFVTGGTYSNEVLSLTRNDGNVINISGIVDSYTTGATLSGTTLLLSRNQGLNDVTVDLLPLTLAADRFVSGGTYNSSGQTIDFTGNDSLTTFSVDVSNLLDDTNTFVTGFTYNSSANQLTISRNDGQEYDTFINEFSGLTITNDLNVIGNVSGDTFYGDGVGLENVIINFIISGDTGGPQVISNADVLHFIGGRGIRTDITFSDSVEIETTSDVPLTTDPNVTFEGTVNIENGLNVTGTTTSDFFIGDGSGLTNLNLSGTTDTVLTGATFDGNSTILTLGISDGSIITTTINSFSGVTILNDGDIIPETDNTSSVGTPIRRFRNINTVNGTSTHWESTTAQITTLSATTINLGYDSGSELRILNADTSILKNDCLDNGTY